MGVAFFILGLYALVTLAAIGGIIYLVIRRNRVKKKERFERRSN
jgi:hypothetical protein